MNSTQIQKRPHLTVLNIVRALAIVAVVIVHASSTSIVDVAKDANSYFGYNFLNIFFKVGTTTFIFLSALVLFYSYIQRPLTGQLFTRFYKRRILYIIVPYTLFSVAYYLLKMYYSYLYSPDHWTNYLSWSGLLTDWMNGKAFYHLYFVYISIQFYLLFPILLWVYKKIPKIAGTMVCVGLVIHIGFILGNFYYFKLPDKSMWFVSYLSYYLLGAYIGIHYEKIVGWLRGTTKHKWKSYTSTALLWIAWFAAAYANVWIWYQGRAHGEYEHALTYEFVWLLQTLLTTIVLIQFSYVLMKYLPRWILNILIHIGAVSFGIYIIHAGILHLYFQLPNSSVPLYYHLYILGAFGVTFILSWSIVGLTHRFIPFSWVLFGSDPRPIQYIKKK